MPVKAVEDLNIKPIYVIIFCFIFCDITLCRIISPFVDIGLVNHVTFVEGISLCSNSLDISNHRIVNTFVTGTIDSGSSWAIIFQWYRFNCFGERGHKPMFLFQIEIFSFIQTQMG